MARKKKTHRVIWTVEYSRAKKCWNILRLKIVYAARVKKSDAVEHAAKLCTIEHQEIGTLSELHIRNKDGTFRTPRTYGDDPVASKG